MSDNADFWEKAHKAGLYKNWSDVVEKKPYLIKAIEYAKRNKGGALSALDLGCSTGDYSIILAQNGFSVMGFDISPTAIEIAKKQANELGYKNCKFFVSDVLKLSESDIKNSSHDLVIDYSCLTHFKKEDWKKYLERIKNSLRTGGIFLLSVWGKDSTNAYGHNPKEAKENDFIAKTEEFGFFYNYFFTPKELKNLLDKDYEVLLMEEKTLESFKKIQPDSDLKLIFAIVKKK